MRRLHVATFCGAWNIYRPNRLALNLPKDAGKLERSHGARGEEFCHAYAFDHN